MQIPLVCDKWLRYLRHARKQFLCQPVFVWRQSEFAFFGAVTSVAALFNLGGGEEMNLQDEYLAMCKRVEALEDGKRLTSDDTPDDPMEKYIWLILQILYREFVLNPMKNDEKSENDKAFYERLIRNVNEWVASKK